VVGITSQQGENMTDEGFASTGGVVRLLETEPTHEERYAHAFALLALLKPTLGPSTAQTLQKEAAQ